jgi:GntR family transcriptional regulator
MVDPTSTVPLYVQLADMLQGMIRSGQLPAGRPMPSQSRLVQEYGVGRATAHRAVQLLVERGLVVAMPRRGAYVR